MGQLTTIHHSNGCAFGSQPNPLFISPIFTYSERYNGEGSSSCPADDAGDDFRALVSVGALSAAPAGCMIGDPWLVLLRLKPRQPLFLNA